MKMTLTTSQAASLLSAENNGFTYSGAYALCEYLGELESDCGKEIEFDPVAIRCDFAEYASLADFRDEYFADDEQCRADIGALAGGEDDEELNELTREYIQDHGTLIEFAGGVIVSAF